MNASDLGAALEAFYASPHGLYAQKALSPYFRTARSERAYNILIVGYALPFIHAVRGARNVALMPEASLQAPAITPGVTFVPHREDGSLPFKAETFHRIFLIHCLEHAIFPGHLMREVSRCLTFAGKLTLFLPTKKAYTSTLFPQKTQEDLWNAKTFTTLLSESGLTEHKKSSALFFSNVCNTRRRHFALCFEHMFRHCNLNLGGSIEVIQATKHAKHAHPDRQWQTLMPQMSS